MSIPGQEKMWDKEEKEHRKYDDIRIFTDDQLKNYKDDDLKNYKCKHDIAQLEELEKRSVSSFVSDLKREAVHRHKVGRTT